MSNDIVMALQGLSLHRMASASPELLGTARMKSLDHEPVRHQLIEAESAQREMRSLAYQTRVARFPAHRDLAGVRFFSTAELVNLLEHGKAQGKAGRTANILVPGEGIEPTLLSKLDFEKSASTFQ